MRPSEEKKRVVPTMLRIIIHGCSKGISTKKSETEIIIAAIHIHRTIPPEMKPSQIAQGGIGETKTSSIYF
jgi:hypothetical protein